MKAEEIATKLMDEIVHDNGMASRGVILNYTPYLSNIAEKVNFVIENNGSDFFTEEMISLLGSGCFDDDYEKLINETVGLRELDDVLGDFFDNFE